MQLDQVTEGMLLARDVRDPNGAILMRAGAAMTERYIKALKAWGILEVAIQSADDPVAIPVTDPAVIAEVRRLLDAQFNLSNREHPAVHALYEICLEHSLRHR
jgi:hypothetical protein